MVEELKAELRKLENLIGFEGKVNVTSRSFTLELIRALDARYKTDLKNNIRLHRLEFYHDLIESARLEKRKAVELEENFLLSKKMKQREKKQEEGEEGEEAEEREVKEEDRFKRPDEFVALQAKDIDEWVG
ncbi:uncharacterized protein CDAR_223711 [Caerostris darwini]|uniref:Uncharacterized protein n=1 Tax=Caerostris darwini TaxID=1538125 RepID=A0AAV4RXT9_9ARAC|nr:uncharacterized protein CDAR_223711 [Caerostris darwini]